ncbi:ribosomal RNA-processing protein 8 [Tachysurus fulvidraco]|uniref:ribosomal RNA-processing protein 8 n=1 Tax=Tachysurus fulvidraco TaxID=1234273 RepID=UPI000F507276|nr:ribosomal RNA-processing protein 8 [Tachysurus fulvidraco]XP_026994555.1 ribosomal RNA-processing protein 8 [Tachysurus fulvidraco]
MFAEEDWTDNLPFNAQGLTVVNTEPLLEKHKTISKQCLKRTLQTLGSAPDWEYTKPSVGSFDENEEAPIHLLKKKKKRCKKQKKISDTRSEDVRRETDILQKPVKKRQVKPKLDTATSERNSKKFYKAVEDSADKRMSRQQWKNKMKSKRRCKNKFLLNSAAHADLKLEENVTQTQVCTTAEKMQDDDSSLWRMASVENNDNVALNKKAYKKAQVTTKKVNKVAHRLTPIKTVSDGLKTDEHNKFEKQSPVKVDKKSWLQAKKLRSLLNINATESDKKASEANLEQKKEPLEKEHLEKDSEGQMDRSSALRSRMEKRLESARFRYINEQLYTSTSGEAKRMFMQDPDAIRIYHRGYTEQVKHWPANPVDSIISYIRQRSSSLVIADFGCGECKIAQSVKNKVHCFDLAPVCDLVTVCDMANVPLGDSTVDIAVFCLSLMGTNLADFLAEANRVLVMGGVLKVAEVSSRFDNIRQFIGELSHLGFKVVSKDTDNSHFYSFEFLKTHSVSKDVKKIKLELKPCLYKKR